MNWPAGVYFLDPSDVSALEHYLLRRGLISSTDHVASAKKAGEGNMNCAVRVETAQDRFILKQSRPWVEKYSHIAAPWDRALVEARFYELVSTCEEAARWMPALRSVDAEARLLCIEDVGASADFTSMYTGRRIGSEELRMLMSFLTALHSSFRAHPRAPEMANREMRELNHQHIFVIPLEALQPDPTYAAEIESLGDEYLADGEFLLHGDYFPGSWLDSESGVRVIDPEFSFFGPPEFDLGAMIAHLHLARSSDLVETVFHMYGFKPVRRKRALQFAGVEIMRRLLGVAKVPVSFTEEEQRDLLARCRSMVVQ